MRRSKNREELKVRRAELEMRGVLGTLLAKEADGTITETESETLEENAGRDAGGQSSGSAAP